MRIKHKLDLGMFVLLISVGVAILICKGAIKEVLGKK